MFGTNPIRKVDDGDGRALHVQEIFYTLQGEGPSAGTPATFVRTWGCHLRCWFCDTDFESNKESLSVETIGDTAAKFGARLVVLTGGEPMRQNLVPLVAHLIARGHEVQIETAGSFWWHGAGHSELYEPRVRNRWSFIVSPKTPYVDELTAEDARAFKYVVSTRIDLDADGLPIANYQERCGTARRLARPPTHWRTVRREDIFVQPMDEGDAAQNEANRALCTRIALAHGYRVSLQTHKLLNIP